jgi:hypothetical protein
MPQTVHVIYHYEDGSWWADSPDVARWSAVANNVVELVELVCDGVPFALDSEDVEIAHIPAPDLLDVFTGGTVGGRLRVRISETFRSLLSEPLMVPEGPVPAACGS